MCCSAVGPFFGVGVGYGFPGWVLFGAGTGAGAVCGVGFGSGLITGGGSAFVPLGFNMGYVVVITISRKLLGRCP